MKTRFCPSPTGFIHLGNARTALFNYLLADAQSGTFLLRIEDTDRERFKPEYDQALQHDLHWLGLAWDEGPGPEGSSSPYYQSERQSIYDAYYERLLTEGAAYPCFCSDDQLTLARRIARSRGQPPRYSGVCRTLSSQEVEARLAQGEKPTLRFRVEDDAEVVFTDLVRGEQRFRTNDMGDFIIRRANGTASFMFCNAIDDALMEVTHALRGEDHLTNTPRQILILQALGLEPPTYGHISLIVGAGGSPLSKRNGSRSIRELRQLGFLPEAVNNYMARLGHRYSNESFMSLSQLACAFDVASLSKSPAQFNLPQLHYWQKEAVMRLTKEAFWRWAGASVHDLVPEASRNLFMETIQPNVLFPEEVQVWASICFSSEPLFVSETDREILAAAGAAYFREALIAYERYSQNYLKMIDHLKETLHLKGKALFQPLRIALTGQAHGPELAKFLLLMDSDLVLQRLTRDR